MAEANNAILRKVTLHAARSKEFPDGSIGTATISSRP